MGRAAGTAVPTQRSHDKFAAARAASELYDLTHGCLMLLCY